MRSKTIRFKDSLSLVLAGEAGQGIQTIDVLLTRLAKQSGYHVFSTKEYMSRVRGGLNSTEIRISSTPVQAFINRIDILVPLSPGALRHLQQRITKKTALLGEKKDIDEDTPAQKYEVPFSKLAKDLGGPLYRNTLAIGTIAGLLDLESQLVLTTIHEFFSSKRKDIIDKNVKAVQKGLELGSELRGSKKLQVDLHPDEAVRDMILLSGTEAVAMGALAGGCTFLSSYPMSPSTGVLTFLSQHSHEFDIIAEQAEDEIAAVNMALGAWYAGARAMVTTSGGGFALMVEGLSLAGMIESPLVIHLAQRPGPATGLPTRTEQADLEFALYAGHGEFPRAILAPGTLEEGFRLTYHAFALADSFQIPVFLLTDQYFVDSYYNLPLPLLDGIENHNHIIQTGKEYQRYARAKKGISPRGIPSFGEGFVCVDSDEHDEEGRITEKKAVRVGMVDKRLSKRASLEKKTLPPRFEGKSSFKTLVIGWGSTYPAIQEALHHLQRNDVGFLHFSQVYPLHSSTSSYLEKADQTIIVENNATSQFGTLIKLHTGISIDHAVLQYDGHPFAVEDIERNIRSLLRRRTP